MALATSPAHAGSRFANHRRAAYVVVPEENVQTVSAKDSRVIRVALVMQKPQQAGVRIQTAGRAGYTYVDVPASR